MGVVIILPVILIYSVSNPTPIAKHITVSYEVKLMAVLLSKGWFYKPDKVISNTILTIY